MNRFLISTILTAALLASCGPIPTPQPTVDIVATTGAISGTMVAATLTAQSTAIPISTDTPPPTETLTPLSIATSTPEPVTPTVTTTPFEGMFAPGNTEGLATGLVRIENYTEQEIVVTFEGVTWTREQPVYYSWKVGSSALLQEVFWGRYQYRIVIGNKTTLKGNFQINNKDKTTFKVYKNKVAILGP
jgi:hypothetical protein